MFIWNFLVTTKFDVNIFLLYRYLYFIYVFSENINLLLYLNANLNLLLTLIFKKIEVDIYYLYEIKITFKSNADPIYLNIFIWKCSLFSIKISLGINIVV